MYYLFSPDSKQLTYMARKGDKWLMVVNNSEGKLYGGIVPQSFSLDSQQLVYIAGTGAPKEKNLLLVNNGKEEKGYFALSSFGFSSDGQKIAYIGLQMENSKGPKDLKIFLVVNGEKDNKLYNFDSPSYLAEYPAYFPLEPTPIFSPDGQKIAYRGRKEGKVFLVVNGEETKPYEGIFSFQFSPDSKHLAYAAQSKWLKNHWQWIMVVDGKESPVYDDIYFKNIKFSADSKYIVYGVKMGNELWRMVDEVNGDMIQSGKTPIDMGKPYIKVISPNGGEILRVGETYTISWLANNVENVIISLLQGNSRAYLISPKTGVSASLGKFDWKIDDAFYVGQNDLKIVLSNAEYCDYVSESTGVDCAKDELSHGDASNDFSVIKPSVRYLELRNAITTNKSAQVKTAWSDQICLS